MTTKQRRRTTAQSGTNTPAVRRLLAAWRRALTVESDPERRMILEPLMLGIVGGIQTLPRLIHGDKLLLALDAIAFLHHARAESGAPKINPRHFSLDRVRTRTREALRGWSATLPPPETIYVGEHRGGQSIGLVVLHRVLQNATMLDQMTFDVDMIADALLMEWMLVAPDHERQGLFYFLMSIESDWITEADFKEVK